MQRENVKASFFDVLLIVALAGCAPIEPPVDEPDAGPPAPSSCEQAEYQLRTLGCVPESVCSDADCDDFGDRCEALERDLPGYLNLPCLQNASSCEAVEACAQ